MLINRSEYPISGVEINPKAPVQSVVKWMIAVAGYGAVGRARAEWPAAPGDDVRIIQRQSSPALPPGVASAYLASQAPMTRRWVRERPEREGKMLSFCTGNTVDEIRKLLKDADKIRIAVAYWGAKAVDNLELEKLTPRDLAIVCDGKSGGCNATEIERLSRFDWKRKGAYLRQTTCKGLAD